MRQQLVDPALVADQYSNERNLQARQSIYARHAGPNAREVVFDVVASLDPRRVLEVGGGEGELAERLVSELGVDVTLVDQSARMVELAQDRGVDAAVGDVQRLRFADGTSDTAIAAWMLYHVSDIDLGLSELARVLGEGGRLVAVTNARDHLLELRRVIEIDFESTFTRESGEEALLRHFTSVERTDLDGIVTITDSQSVYAYRDSMITSEKSQLTFELPLRVRTAVSVFVAAK
jgi:SAM-dependent methyltransferase